MANIAKQSIRIELNSNGYDDPQALFEDTLYEAVERLIPDAEFQTECLTEHFFTMRFDKLNDGGLAATLTASEKKA